jgi:segregation and condensation protein A
VPLDEDEEEDPGELLARQLLEYKRFKQVALQLRALEETGRREYPRIAAPPQIDTRLKPGDVTLDELAAAFRRALEAHPPAAPVDEVIAPVTVRIVDCIQHLSRAVRRYPRVRLSTITRHAGSRLEVIVYFLAMLELIKQQRLRATQEHSMGEIYLEAREPDPEAELQPVDLSEYGEGAAAPEAAQGEEDMVDGPEEGAEPR